MNDETVFLQMIESPIVKIKSMVINASCPHCRNKCDYTVTVDNGVTVKNNGDGMSALRQFGGIMMCVFCRKSFTIKAI